MKLPELPPIDKMTSLEHHLKDEFSTTSTMVILALFFILLVACMYPKTSKKFIKCGRFFPRMRDRKRLPEEHEDNYSEVRFLLT